MALLALGMHIFDIEPLNYQQLVRETVVKFPAIARFGQRPVRQFTGYGEDPVRLSGLLYPHELGGRAEFEAIRATQKLARPVQMMGWAHEDSNRVDMWGEVVILSVKDTQSRLDARGHGRKLSFEIEVAPVGDFVSLGAGWFG